VLPARYSGPQSAGHQPMVRIRRLDLFIVFNGEVYNFVSCAKVLLRGGKRLSGPTPTLEVVLRLFPRQGPAALSLLEGMFAWPFGGLSPGKWFWHVIGSA